ncbi:sel1 repeat family protein [Pelomyxa schiedti]|nr:sel1 repeat family protein [Pelomyxa schiedti]
MSYSPCFDFTQSKKGKWPEPLQGPDLCYLPGLLFIRGLALLSNDQTALNRCMPPDLSSSFSRVTSSSALELRAYCRNVLLSANSVVAPLTAQIHQNEEIGEGEAATVKMMRITEEWNALFAAACDGAALDSRSPVEQEPISTQIDTQQEEQKRPWAFTLFVALWTTFCLENTSCEPFWLELSASRTNCGQNDTAQLLPSSSLSLLGACFLHGIGGLDQYTNRAVSLYQKAADAGNAVALNSLGVCYEIGKGVDKDLHKAVSLYAKASDAGNNKAIYNVALCYKNGEGVEMDLNKAISLFRRAVDAGNASAMLKLGMCYGSGSGVDKDMNKAVELFRMSANSGEIDALVQLGVLYRNGSGVEKDLTQTVSLLRRAADYGSSAAMFYLGQCYHIGLGVEKDLGIGVSFYRRAMDSGCVPAIFSLGACYQKAWGVDKDINQAASLYQRAADAGDASGMYHLGVCYQHGRGVHRDIRVAVSHIRRAANQGHKHAILRLDRLLASCRS